VINVSLVTLNNATLYNVYVPYITHLICIYCTLYHLLHLVYAVRPSLFHIFICTYSDSFLYTCVYKVVVMKLLDYLLDIIAWSKHQHFSALALTSANHVYVTNNI
jgi:hypothetical protein